MTGINGINIDLASIIWAVIAVAAIVVASMQSGKYLKLKAMDDCARATRYEVTDKNTGAKASYPVTDLYEKCVTSKGYEAN